MIPLSLFIGNIVLGMIGLFIFTFSKDPITKSLSSVNVGSVAVVILCGVVVFLFSIGIFLLEEFTDENHF